MNKEKIRIGFIGLNPDSHWASRSHLPALKTLTDDFEIKGVANSTHASAQRTANALQIPYAFENVQALIHSDEIDLVVVTVKVPYHYELVRDVLAAGKHVYCEHPLGNGLKEVKQLAALAADKGVVAVVGTQMVVSPQVVYLQELINNGFVGKVLSTTLIGSGGQWRDETLRDVYYMYDKNNGATLLTIPLAHTLAGLIKVVGGFDQLTSRMTSNYSTVKLNDTGEVKPKTAEDQIMVMGTLKSGAAISIHYRGGMSKGTNFLWEINGSEGDIQVTGNIGHGQLAQLSIYGAGREDKALKLLNPPPENPVAENVARMYELIAGDIKNGTRKAPTFYDAVSLHTVLQAIETNE
ncbi:Predicted dehydrogenase [Chitinophaga sp. YR573]|uniref:Gfo/Idh/MocA family protein n=1 Tax=Chitinophaga sp. YR573 TaxID=1881040 RepID=UPI0008C92F16|nr:Gfo/Idh/MocA family oxidoreductase [Chitinophaga sp. YR573]SEV95231.1 Predicted dehydrogenase [Chitinophaga sp. YR573]